MYGAFYVVEDLDAYLSNPESYLADHPLPISDELLTLNRPRKEWTYDDLASTIEAMDHGRSFARGKQLFRVASCVSCHVMNGEGVAVGPDLTKLDPPMKTTELLRHIIEPSLKIDDKFQSWSLALKSGKVVTGLIQSETAASVVLLENPMAQAAPSHDRQGRDRRAGQVSGVDHAPRGLLDKLSREEVLDLVAYVAAKGNDHDALYHGGGPRPPRDDEAGRRIRRDHLHRRPGEGGGETDRPDQRRRGSIAPRRRCRSLPRSSAFATASAARSLFAIGKDGAIDPNVSNIPGLEALRTADLMILFTRFRDLPDDQMKEIADYVQSGRPILGMRTATHAFNIKPGKTFSSYSHDSQEWNGGFGRQVPRRNLDQPPRQARLPKHPGNSGGRRQGFPDLARDQGRRHLGPDRRLWRAVATARRQQAPGTRAGRRRYDPDRPGGGRDRKTTR